MTTELKNIVDSFRGSLDKKIFRIDHPCISTDNHNVIIGHEYYLLRPFLPVEKIIIKRIHLNITNLKIKVVSLQDNESFWIIQYFDDFCWNNSDWQLLDISNMIN